MHPDSGYDQLAERRPGIGDRKGQAERFGANFKTLNLPDIELVEESREGEARAPHPGCTFVGRKPATRTFSLRAEVEDARTSDKRGERVEFFEVDGVRPLIHCGA